MKNYRIISIDKVEYTKYSDVLRITACEKKYFWLSPFVSPKETFFIISTASPMVNNVESAKGSRRLWSVEETMFELDFFKGITYYIEKDIDLYEQRKVDGAYKGNVFFSYSFIPTVIDLYNQRKIDEEKLTDISLWKRFLKRSFGNTYKTNNWDRAWGLLDQILVPNHRMLLINFPGPYRLGAAKQGFIVCHCLDHKARYFTMECSMDGYMVCESVGITRHYHGVQLHDTRAFILQVLEIANINISEL